jgi:hypothetical protein
VFIVVIIDVIVIGVTHVVNVGNVVDFHGCPSNFCRGLHPSMDTPQLIESWYHLV